MFVGLKRLHIHIPPSPISQSLLPLTSFPSKRGQRSIFEGGGGAKKNFWVLHARANFTHIFKNPEYAPERTDIKIDSTLEYLLQDFPMNPTVCPLLC